MCFKRYHEEKEKTSHRKKKIYTNHISDKELVSKTSKFLKLGKTKKTQLKIIHLIRGFPGGAVVENLPANAGDTGSSPGLGRSHMPRSN